MLDDEKGTTAVVNNSTPTYEGWEWITDEEMTAIIKRAEFQILKALILGSGGNLNWHLLKYHCHRAGRLSGMMEWRRI
jgi:hypothetical protein